ncbi:MAG: 16S rRNA (cytidine(1402)-2'-O)-methyltransferase [Steroidobacteraceae bacterium]|nr:16S rRNA (cytidine(1402)-2'-O)-methyltransferase [Steroidobacteraceae bacterium]
MTTAGRLFVVATPIGHLGDVSQRMRDTLAAVAVVAAEDTRHTGRLLQALGIEVPLLSLHEHNERERAAQLVARLVAGEDVAVVSDAGTPLVSDPGFVLVRAAIEAGITAVPVPGPCAAIAALSVSGLPTDRFCFEGFLPARPGARREQLAAVAAEPRTMVFYEAPQRLADSLADMAAVLGATRRAAVARELTKAFETVYHGDLATLAARAAADANMTRGEIVVVVEGRAEAPASGAEMDRILRILLASLPPSQAASLAAGIAGAPRNACYRRAQEIAREGS